MARSTFGGFGGDQVSLDPAVNAGFYKAAANLPATGTFWSASTGGTQWTDLVDPGTGVALAGVSTDAHGHVVPFKGPDGIVEGWVDFGGGRFKLTAVDSGVFLTPTVGDGRYVGLSMAGIVLPPTTSITDIQAAATSAATFGTRLTVAGTVTTATTLTLQCDADLSGLTINYSGTSTAVIFGNASAAFFRKTVKMPKVIATAKTNTGWAQVAGAVGIDIVNCYACTITVPYVQNFETGLQLRGAASNGSQQNTVHIGHLDNNKQNLVFTGDATGWANENHFYGGRCSHSSSEGSQVAGTRHVVLQNLANPVNGNSFYGVSLESPDVVEYHIEAANAQWQTFVSSRFENTGGDTHRRILSSGNSKNNRLLGGAYAGNVTQVITSPALPFDIDTPEMTTKHGGTSTVPTLLLENVTSSTAPAFTIMAAGAGAAGSDPSAAYCVKATANTWAGKRSTDAAGSDRLIMDFQNGRLYLGDATAAPVGYIGGSATTVFVGGGLPFIPLANGTQDLGLTSLKWRYIRAGTAVQTGALTTAGRPTAATAGAGAMYYDTTLNKPAWSDGTNWRDATGTIV
jgi:hypothetical protein